MGGIRVTVVAEFPVEYGKLVQRRQVDQNDPPPVSAPGFNYVRTTIGTHHAPARLVARQLGRHSGSKHSRRDQVRRRP
jgi:hypothetical protein